MAKARAALCTALIALSGCASNWRTLPIDGSSQSSTEASIALIQQQLGYLHRMRFSILLEDLWITGQRSAEASGTDYTAGDFIARLDGLSYRDLLRLAGPDITPRYSAAVRGHAIDHSAMSDRSLQDRISEGNGRSSLRPPGLTVYSSP